MINNVVAVVASIAVVTILFGALYVWFGVSLRRLNGAAATGTCWPDGMLGWRSCRRTTANSCAHSRRSRFWNLLSLCRPRGCGGSS